MQKLRQIRPLARPRPHQLLGADDVPKLRPIPRRPRARVLSFDIENRPLSYLGFDRVSAEVTAIAAAWTDDPANVMVWLLGHYTSHEMLTEFRHIYDQATMVTGHYIRGHDLPILNMALIEAGLDPLPAKLTQDTCKDLVRFKDVSKSQEALGAMFGIEAPKEQMTQSDWREANRLTAPGLEQTRRRVVGDVRQHIMLREVLLERGLLRAPRMWSSGGTRRSA